jgi:hypothetical protein
MLRTCFVVGTAINGRENKNEKKCSFSLRRFSAFDKK